MSQGRVLVLGSTAKRCVSKDGSGHPSFETRAKALLRMRSGRAEMRRKTYAASIRRKPFHIAVAAPEVSTGRMRVS